MKSDSMVISVVVIGLNEEKLIGKFMASLASQQLSKPFEVIFVDGGSTDRTVSIVRQFSHRLRLRIIINKGKPIGDAREIGFRAAHAPIIASTDSDVILPKRWLVTIVDYFRTHPEDIGIVGPYTIYPASKILQYIFLAAIRAVDFVHKAFVGFPVFRGLNFGVRRLSWKKSKGFERSVSALEDVDLALKMSKIGRIGYDSSLVVYTSPRRFNKHFFIRLCYRMLVYYHRVVLRDYEYGEWEQIRE